MNRASKISSREEFAAEVRREVIRDQRWRRRRSKIVCACGVSASLLGIALQTHALSILVAWL